MNCDNCMHYCWYYDYCEKWDCEVDAREVHNCFEERDHPIRDAMVHGVNMHEDKLMKTDEWLSNDIDDALVKAYERLKLNEDLWKQLKETVQEICDNNKDNEERMLVATFILNLMNGLEKEHE